MASPLAPSAGPTMQQGHGAVGSNTPSFTAQTLTPTLGGASSLASPPPGSVGAGSSRRGRSPVEGRTDRRAFLSHMKTEHVFLP
jgi:hypothetical protein